MRIVSRHLLFEFLTSSAAVLLALLVTWTAGDSLRHLDELSHSWQAGLQQLVLGAIEVVPFGVPLACVVGAVWTLTRAARHRELTAIRAGGIPLKRSGAPLSRWASASSKIASSSRSA